MPTPRRRTTRETVEEITTPTEGAETIIEDEDTPEDLALAGFLSEIRGSGQDTIANVYRASGKGRRLAFMFAFSPDEMTGGELMEKIRDEYGHGDYRVHVRDDNALIANRPITIAEKVVKDEPTQKEVNQFGPTELIAMMTKQNESMQTMFMGVMQSMAEAFRGNNANAPAPVDPVAQQAAIISGIAQMKEIADSGSKGPDAMAMLLKGLELAKDFAPKTGETNMADIATKFIEAFPILSQAGSRGGAAPTGQPHPMVPRPVPGHPIQPGPVPRGAVPTDKPLPPKTGAPPQATPQPTVFRPTEQPAPEPAPATEDQEAAAFMAQAQANLKWLCLQARANRNPELYAEVVLDQMGEEAVLGFIGQENALNLLAQVEPEVGLYPGWFESLRNAILLMTREETAPDDQEPTGADDVDDDTEIPTPAMVVARIDESGLRREDRQGATVNIPAIEPHPEGVTIDATGDGVVSESASDT